VVAGGPAQRAGLQVRDLVVSLDGAPIATLSDLQRSLAADRIGRSVEVGYVRFGELHRTTLTPAEAR
jgi:serine protease Do